MGSRAYVASLVPLLLALSPATAAGQGLPPWTAPSRLPLPEDFGVAEVVRKDEPIFVEPSRGARRRGAAARDAHLRVYGVTEGPGCNGSWLLVGSEAWLCSDGAAFHPANPARSGDAPGPSPAGGANPMSALPFDYYFVGRDGAFGYPDLDTAEQVRPTAELQPDYAVALVMRGRPGASTDVLGLTTKGLWVPLRDLRPVTPPPLHGYEVGPTGLDRGFVINEGVVPRDAPRGDRTAGSARRRFEQVRILEETVDRSGSSWLRVEGGGWMHEDDVRRPRATSPPPGVQPLARWIDVDRERQILTAYDGSRPVFVALVSTGKGSDAEPTATPLGLHRIWVKLRSTDMTNLEDENARRYYAMQEVPWVLFFKEGYGLHGAFWHHSFGRVRSQGCVNLSPADAAWLFDFAGPHLPRGWTAVLPTEYDPGTAVRVR